MNIYAPKSKKLSKAVPEFAKSYRFQLPTNSVSPQGLSTSSPYCSSTPWWKYNVFLSFRGKDTRRSFTDHLYDALKRKGVLTFRNDEKLERGKSISQELLKSIEEFRFAIVIFSRNYASSIWCLNELEKNVRSIKETASTILLVFYDVDASNVRNQTGPFQNAFDDLKNQFKENLEKVEIGRAVLREVANISGWPLQNRHEVEFIQHIVEVILHKLSSGFSSIPTELETILKVQEEHCQDPNSIPLTQEEISNKVFKKKSGIVKELGMIPSSSLITAALSSSSKTILKLQEEHCQDPDSIPLTQEEISNKVFKKKSIIVKEFNMITSSSLITTTSSSSSVEYIHRLESEIIELKEARAKQEEVQKNILNFLRSKGYDDTLTYGGSSSSS